MPMLFSHFYKQCNVALCSKCCLTSASEINMLRFICFFSLNEKKKKKNSNIFSIRKCYYRFTGKISRFCKKKTDREIDKKRGKKLEKCLRRCVKSRRHFENNVEKKAEKMSRPLHRRAAVIG